MTIKYLCIRHEINIVSFFHGKEGEKQNENNMEKTNDLHGNTSNDI